MSESCTVTSAGFQLSEEALLCMGQGLATNVSAWLTEYYGERCREHADECPTCKKWAAFDSLFGGLE